VVWPAAIRAPVASMERLRSDARTKPGGRRRTRPGGGRRGAVIVDGKPESLAAFDASVWVRRGDAWLCALHTESLKGDPFGRHDIQLPETERTSGSR
jgi:hypothetical protein